jgi:hypothetical protein
VFALLEGGCDGFNIWWAGDRPGLRDQLVKTQESINVGDLLVVAPFYVDDFSSDLEEVVHQISTEIRTADCLFE